MLLSIPLDASRSDSCINNVKLTLNCTKDYHRSPHRHSTDNVAYTKRSKDKLSRSKDKFARISLENVSANPWGEQFDGQSSLRRTRSLAVSKENLFYSLDYGYNSHQHHGQERRRRAQLIPRAKLIERTTSKDTRFKGSSVETLYQTGSYQKTRRKSDLTPPDYTPPEENYIERHRQQRDSEEIYSYASVKRFDPNPQQQDSLDSNYNNKTSINSPYRVSYEELSLPHYYPEARYDTDNTTDNISLTDNISSVSLDNISKIKASSFDNLDLKWERNELYESIPYDENIVLSPNKILYDKPEIKLRTIRKPTAYQESYGKINPKCIEPSDEEPSIEQTDTNSDEINLNNENISKVPESSLIPPPIQNTLADPVTVEDPIEPVVELKDPELILRDRVATDKDKPSKNLIKTLIEVPPSETNSAENNEQYKTVVRVESPRTQESRSKEETKCKHNRKESKTHSHNYLKEFLETQKGSKKPLQNFIAKKFSNLSRRNSKIVTNLTENQFHSLPDISVSKNLRKCEKIDRKLRKCEKSEQLSRTRDASKENRFIVNIGRHFDITANSSVPLDFEVKIAKIPKKSKKSSTINKPRSEEQFLEAVKNLKATLGGSHMNLNETGNNCTFVDPPTLSKEINNIESMSKSECTNELQEKLGSMRNYWDKMVGKQDNEEEKEGLPCKIVELQTKVEDVKKKFENIEGKREEKPPNKVQLTKQIFEPKTALERGDKISPLIKESCSYFENNSHLFSNDRPFESLCPNSVEIVDVKSTEKLDKINENNPGTKKRTHKPISKSNSICTQPEFDHVRYKVVKSDLFQKKIFANCEKESQFDGLIKYLQDYSFQELLLDNNVVIIEPIRSKVPYEPSQCVKSMKNVTPALNRNETINYEDKSALNRPFFYHPIRVNKEVNDNELPNPDTVRQVRQFFEGGLKKSQSTQDICTTVKENLSTNNVDPDKDRCSASDSNSHPSNISDFGSQENLYDSIDNEIYCEYVSEDILEKIRERGTTVTYYGGRVVTQNSGQPLLTKAIMEEIRNNEKKCRECKNCRNNLEDETEGNKKETYIGMKFRILKSNSCSSRLELLGTENVQDTKKRFISQHKKLMKQENMRKKDTTIKEVSEKDVEQETVIRNKKYSEKNSINENIKMQNKMKNENQPKIIGEEMKVKETKMTQWKEVKNGNTCNVNFNEKGSQKIYDYYHYDMVKTKTKKLDDMEFEAYEVA